MILRASLPEHSLTAVSFFLKITKKNQGQTLSLVRQPRVTVGRCYKVVERGRLDRGTGTVLRGRDSTANINRRMLDGCWQGEG